MKLGRNDLCHCGSGKKYKRCHLDHDREAEKRRAQFAGGLVLDAISVRLGEVAGSTADFGDRVIAPADAVHNPFLERIGEGIDGREAAEALQQYLVGLEQAMVPLAQRHSRAYWVHIARRLEPVPLNDSSAWTMALYRRILFLALIKHGLANEEGDTFMEMEAAIGRTLVPTELTEQDVVDLFALEYLAYEYAAGAAAFRRVGKGGRPAGRRGRLSGCSGEGRRGTRSAA